MRRDTDRVTRRLPCAELERVLASPRRVNQHQHAVAGTVIGAVAGGLIGNAIGHGRAGGTIVGAGVGAVAGHQIGKNTHPC